MHEFSLSGKIPSNDSVRHMELAHYQIYGLGSVTAKIVIFWLWAYVVKSVLGIRGESYQMWFAWKLNQSLMTSQKVLIFYTEYWTDNNFLFFCQCWSRGIINLMDYLAHDGYLWSPLWWEFQSVSHLITILHQQVLKWLS